MANDVWTYCGFVEDEVDGLVHAVYADCMRGIYYTACNLYLGRRYPVRPEVYAPVRIVTCLHCLAVALGDGPEELPKKWGFGRVRWNHASGLVTVDWLDVDLFKGAGFGPDDDIRFERLYPAQLTFAGPLVLPSRELASMLMAWPEADQTP